ncbi:MAG: heavy-metal-associated domain-containing protein [Kofleriaceae bacterium]|mgnify:CR=1 FL=1|nr:heavy-metal-associated domain-containing protein [Kofleriaceae bacterium]MBP6630990.1 heavy-metal-associated domain-containing protein [Kofleriaceae bacterium]MBP9206470.1 heavy-metal-associated domain-containing protein [Kofleriaceae bacterium]
MRSALAKVPGVYEVGVDVDTESIWVSYDAALGPPKAATAPMLAALRAVGYDPWLARPGWPDRATTQVLPP